MHDGEIVRRRAGGVDGASKSYGPPRESNGGFLRGTKTKDSGCSLGELWDRRGVVGRRKQRKIQDATSAGENGVRERSLICKGVQALKKSEHPVRQKGNFENSGGRGSFEQKWNGLAEVVPEVGPFGFAEGKKLRGLRSCRASEASKFARRAVADFGNAFNADAEVPAISGNVSLQARNGRLRRIFLGFDEEVHELRADDIDRGGAKRRAFNEFGKSESAVGCGEGSDKAAAGRSGGKGPEVEPGYDRESPERADE